MTDPLTHIRTEAPGPDWSGLCGVDKPPSSITRRLYAAQQRGDVMPFNRAITICPQCKELAQ